MSVEDWIETRGRRKGGKFGIFHKPERKDWRKVRARASHIPINQLHAQT